MLMCIYGRPSRNKQYFLDNSLEIIYHYSSIYDNYIIFGDFNMKSSDSLLDAFMQSHNLFNLIKSTTCFKGCGSCTDLILTNRKFCFKMSSAFETGLSDYHHLIYSMLKTTFKKEDSVRFIYPDYKTFNNEYFQNDLKNGLSKCPKTYESFENIFVTVLDRHAPRKTKILRGNQKPHVDKNLRKAIMKRSELKSKANRTKRPKDISDYKKQRNLVVRLNKERKIEYFENLETSKNSKPFWNKCKPYFSNKHAHGESKIILIEKENVILTSNEVVENEKLIVKNDEIAKIFNKHFSETADKLNIFEWPSCEKEYTEDQLTNIINKYKSHPSIKKIKSNYTIKQNFASKPVTVKDIENVIKNIPTNKVTEGEIPLDVLKQSGFT